MTADDAVGCYTLQWEDDSVRPPSWYPSALSLVQRNDSMTIDLFPNRSDTLFFLFDRSWKLVPPDSVQLLFGWASGGLTVRLAVTDTTVRGVFRAAGDVVTDDQPVWFDVSGRRVPCAQISSRAS